MNGTKPQSDPPGWFCPLCDGAEAGPSGRCVSDGAAMVPVAANRPAERSLAGRRLGPVELLEPLGTGASSTVYRARRVTSGEELAVKVLHPPESDAGLWLTRWKREARLASRIDHPHVVRVIDVAIEEGLALVLMELARGRRLDDVLEREGPFPAPRLAAVGKQLAGALAAIHALPAVHRDLKPANVLLGHDPPDHVTVLDFGLARSLGSSTVESVVTADGLVAGSPAWLAPEVVRGAPADPLSDLYSLGAVLFQMATGHPPFSARELDRLLASHVNDPPPPLPGLPRVLENLILRLLAKSPAARYRSAVQVAAALEAAGSWLTTARPGASA